MQQNYTLITYKTIIIKKVINNLPTHKKIKNNFREHRGKKIIKNYFCPSIIIRDCTEATPGTLYAIPTHLNEIHIIKFLYHFLSYLCQFHNQPTDWLI